MAICLTIKGTVADATSALDVRGFHPTDRVTVPEQTQISFSHTVTTVYVKDECEPGVIRWFTELPDKPPFPPGTLLHYSLGRDEATQDPTVNMLALQQALGG